MMESPMQEVAPTRPRHRSPLVLGICLILLGASLLALNLGWRLPFSLRQYWPFALIVPGLVAIAAPSRHLGRSAGIWLIATGIYCEISVTGLFGLGWLSTWPVFIMAYGAELICDSPRNRAADGAADAQPAAGRPEQGES